MAASSRTDVPQPWHAAYPTPTSQAAALPRRELLNWLEGAKVNGKDYVLVDLRRDDFAVSAGCWSYVRDARALVNVCTVGWYNSWVSESTSAELLSDIIGILCLGIE